MGDREHFARLPDSITLDLGEAADVLSALDQGLELAHSGTTAHHDLRGAIRLITRKLWPELGELLDGEE